MILYVELGEGETQKAVAVANGGSHGIAVTIIAVSVTAPPGTEGATLTLSIGDEPILRMRAPAGDTRTFYCTATVTLPPNVPLNMTLEGTAGACASVAIP